MRIAIMAEVFLPKIDGVVNRPLNLIRNLQKAGDELLPGAMSYEDMQKYIEKARAQKKK